MKILVCLCCALVLSATSFAQNATINIKGIIVDERTNQPVGKDFEVTITAKSTSKKYGVKVNSKTGDFLQPLQSGDTYYISYQSYLLYNRTDTLEIPSTNKYREERHNYKVKTIVQGDDLGNFNAFEPGQSTMSQANIDQMRSLLDVVKRNRELNVIVYLNQEQNPPPPVEKKASKPAKVAKKGKSAKNEVAIETLEVKAGQDALNPGLYDARLEVLKKFFSEAKNADIRVRYEQAPPLMAAPGQKNVSAKVGEVKSILED